MHYMCVKTLIKALMGHTDIRTAEGLLTCTCVPCASAAIAVHKE